MIAWVGAAPRRLWCWAREHRATVGFLILGIGVAVAFYGVQVALNRQGNTNDQLRAQTVEVQRQNDLLTAQTAELVRQNQQACDDRKHGWDASHNLVVKAYTPQAPSAALLNAFPQLKPFYTPGNPQYEEQLRRTEEQRDAVLGTLDGRPVC